jgi:hypothetical protein
VGQVNQSPQRGLHFGRPQVRIIHICDVRVDQPDCHATVEDLFGKRVDAVCRQRDRDVVAYSGEGTEVGLAEALRFDLRQCRWQWPRSKRDRRAAESGVDRRS